MRAMLMALALGATMTTGCTMVDKVTLPSVPGGKEVFVTAGDVTEPHEVLGLIQVSRSGPLLFGNIDVVGTDLETGFKKVLLPEVERLGGDGVVRVRYRMTQYTPFARIAGAIFFIFPLPSTVTITGTVVKMKQGLAAPAPAPAVEATPAAAAEPAPTPSAAPTEVKATRATR
ncbi:MAG: hypothetical protein FJ096_11595 [Deltaproteobacteria bacterium]|nr:hypothetical protein [Deltaproteobacteria bacterium]